jgi:16S rRNA (cytidine1402-2'-O)-methyltransferase
MWLLSDINQQRGEFVLLVSGAEPQTGLTMETKHILEVLLKELPLKQAVQLAMQISGASRNELYQYALRIKSPE